MGEEAQYDEQIDETQQKKCEPKCESTTLPEPTTSVVGFFAALLARRTRPLTWSAHPTWSAHVVGLLLRDVGNFRVLRELVEGLLVGVHLLDDALDDVGGVGVRHFAR
jgi:hypothetical protein